MTNDQSDDFAKAIAGLKAAQERAHPVMVEWFIVNDPTTWKSPSVMFMPRDDVERKVFLDDRKFWAQHLNAMHENPCGDLPASITTPPAAKPKPSARDLRKAAKEASRAPRQHECANLNVALAANPDRGLRGMCSRMSEL